MSATSSVESWMCLDSPNSPANGDNSPLGWSRYSIPYQNPHNYLQTLDIHVPASPDGGSSEPPDPGSLAGIWLVFIHGGAWRDPKQSSRGVLPAVRRLLREQKYSAILSRVAGVASLNYSLTSHQVYPPGEGPGDADHPDCVPGARTAKHPQHIHDVRSAIRFLCSEYNMQKYVLVGHSCGATLAFQTLMPQAWAAANSVAGNDLDEQKIPPPLAIGGLAGLYDLPGCVHNAGEQFEPIAPIYREFLTDAFGPDESVWHELSPAATFDPVNTWSSGTTILLSLSKGDTLVPPAQLSSMQQRLQDCWLGTGHVSDAVRSTRQLLIQPFEGDHDDAWEIGIGVADVMARLVEAVI